MARKRKTRRSKGLGEITDLDIASATNEIYQACDKWFPKSEERTACMKGAGKLAEKLQPNAKKWTSR